MADDDQLEVTYDICLHLHIHGLDLVYATTATREWIFTENWADPVWIFTEICLGERPQFCPGSVTSPASS
eukprot:CAMPEP_0167798662 /NCGR_PEP_ID=MMETSP0111_2-20121227/16481_1 /TAXON_ID=91324 /ORGANISM="Lotharella globosa, Strain CCCM811" /LENGTH=69 /DNA_ID=CAMNT_0007693197 /DNA_START=42 /DNA_END=247 /DNA_ORIENTATION=+